MCRKSWKRVAANVAPKSAGSKVSANNRSRMGVFDGRQIGDGVLEAVRDEVGEGMLARTTAV